jgi:hypothetical protein
VALDVGSAGAMKHLQLQTCSFIIYFDVYCLKHVAVTVLYMNPLDGKKQVNTDKNIWFFDAGLLLFFHSIIFHTFIFIFILIIKPTRCNNFSNLFLE